MSIVIFTIPNINFMQKASANSFADIPGYIDEAFVATMVGVMTVATAGAHAQENINDNLGYIRDAAVDTWNAATPVMKKAFADSLTAGADAIVIAGDWITNFLDSFKRTSAGDHVSDIPLDYILTDGGVIDSGNTVSRTVTLKSGYKFKIDGKLVSDSLKIGINVDVWGTTVSLRNMGIGSSGYSVLGTKTFDNSKDGRKFFESVKNGASAGILGMGSAFGVSISVVNSSGIDIPIANNNPIYDQAANWWRDRADAGKLTLGMPRTAPYTKDGRALEVGTTGVLLDGVPYTGELEWRSNLGLGTADAGVLVVPEIMINGVPHVLTKDKTGNYVPVDVVTGTVAKPTDIPNATVKPTEVIWIDGVPFIKTGTGDFVNLLTGEIISGVGNPPIVPPVPPVGDFGSVTTQLNFKPLLMSADAMTKIFPFSLPWDVMRQLSVFDVSPQTPVFKVDVSNYLSIGGYTIPMAFEIDLAMFDVIASVIRWFNVIIWDIGLILIIRRFMPE